jgi:hypothetical protein
LSAEKENPATPKKRVLVVCTGNFARSQIAEGLLSHLAKGELEAFSAGTEPRFVCPLIDRGSGRRPTRIDATGA